MASKKKKSTKKQSAKKQTTKNTQTNQMLHEEIIVWGSLAVSILLLISNFGLAGFIGNAISAGMMKLFGWIAYIIPFALFIAVSFFVSNKENKVAYIKGIAGVVILFLLGAFLELVATKGGMLGKVLIGVLEPALGVLGAYVVIVILFIICTVLITEKSLLKGVKSGSAKASGHMKKMADVHKEQASERQKQRATRQQEKKDVVKGVSMETKLANPPTQDVKEITPLPVKAKTKAKAETFAKAQVATSIENVETPLASLEKAETPPATEAFVINRPTPMPEVEPEVVPKESKAKKSKEVELETKSIEQSIAENKTSQKRAYKAPPISLLQKGQKGGGDSDEHLRETAQKLEQTLRTFGVNVTVTNASCGPAVTRYELQPEMGVKVSKIVGLADDIKLNLAAADIRIEAPIPGKAAVGIEIPNKESAAVMLRDLLETQEFKEKKSKIAFAAGKDIAGATMIADIAKMPHLLVAGSTGSGKSVCMNTLIMSILYGASSEDVKFIMIDPKVVELSVYNNIPHLMIPVVTDPKKAAGALNWAVAEMTRRYQLFAEYGVRDMSGFNEKVVTMEPEEDEEPLAKLPQIVIIVDELADLMMVAPGEVEGAICRLAQLARAAGIHLVLATQRPSVNVITGLIKANMPSRIAFAVSSGVDSRTIIDMNGAEKLLGKGDMLFYPTGYPKPVRVQGAFVSDQEVRAVVEYLIQNNGDANYNEEVEEQVNQGNTASAAAMLEGDEARDANFAEAGRFIIEKEKASIGMLQRAFKIGFNRAARVMDQLCEAGVVGGEEGTKPRKILMSMEEFEQYISE